MRLADTLRLAGGARGVEHHRDVVEVPLFNLGIEEVGMVAIMDAAHFHQLMHVVQERLVVMAHAARIVIDDVLERRQLILDLEQLVDLLLILDDGEADASILQDEEHFGGDRILIERHRHATQALGGAHHHVKVRTVVADDGQVVAALEAERSQTTSQGANALGHIGPAPGLPDAEMLLAHGRRVGPDLGMLKQQPREGVQTVQRIEIHLRGHSFVSSLPRFIESRSNVRLTHCVDSPWPRKPCGAPRESPSVETECREVPQV